MIEEKEIQDELLPAELNKLTLDKETDKIVTEIIAAESVDDLKALTALFALNQAKKNALRVAKLNDLLDKVNDQAIERFTKRPGEISNQEIVGYMKTVQDQIDKAYNVVEHIEEKPLIQINNQTNKVEVNVTDTYTREEKAHVMEAIAALLQQAKAPQEDVIDYSSVDDSDSTGV